MRNLIVLALAASQALACSEPDFVAPPPAPPQDSVSLDELPERYTKAYCQAVADCYGPFALRAHWSPDFGGGCEQMYLPYYQDEVARLIAPGVRRGTIIYDPVGAAAYLRALPATYCKPNAVDDLNFIELGAALVPLLGVDDVCYSRFECGSSLYCDRSQSCPGRCAIRKSDGDDCASRDECIRGYDCVNGKCAPLRDVTQPCGNMLPSCKHPMVCASLLGTELCFMPQALATSDVGQTCLPLTDVGQCLPGLACLPADPSNILSMACGSPVGAGETCAEASTLDGCQTGLFCPEPTQSGVNPSCQPVPQAGQPCAVVFGTPVCGPGLLCNGNGVCTPPRRLHESCSTDVECIGAVCQFGTCTLAKGDCSPP